MTRKKWHTHCTLKDVSVDFGIRCYGCEDRELPKDPTRDMRLCIHEKYVEENENDKEV